MAILDLNLTLAMDQAITSNAISENVILLPAAGTVPREAGAITRNLGPGVPLPMLIQVTETFAGLTSLEITLETSNSADLSSATVIATSGSIPLADLVAGFKPGNMRYMPDAELMNYIGLRFTRTGSNATAGKITAAIGTTVDAG